MNKKLISLTIASIITTGISAEYILKQNVSSGTVFNTEALESNFASHTFTNCGITAYYGPTLDQCKTAYNTEWDEDSDKFNMTTQGFQEWTVPTTGNYRITVLGASGGYMYYSSFNPGRGKSFTGDIELTKGDVLVIVAGSRGGKYGYTGGGGGASFVKIKGESLPLIVAAGGGGAGNSGDAGCDAVYGSLPPSCNVGYNVNLGYGGGNSSNGGWGTGGAGWHGNGLGAPKPGAHQDWQGSKLPTALNNTALGGTATHGDGYINSTHDYYAPSCYGAPGGFGGGGSGQCNGGGAGGGYSGGSAGGAGGGSYYDNSRILNLSHTIGNYGANGSVTIEKL